MQIDLDPRGRKVVIFGDITGTRQALRRFVACGATVTLVLPGSPPGPDARVDSVRYASHPGLDDTAGLLRLIGPAWLIVDVGMLAPLRARAFELAGHLHVLMISEPISPSSGQVTSSGAGRGGPACSPWRRARPCARRM